MSKITIVSTDGHAVMPVEAWPEYLEQPFHEYLPQLRAENDVNARAMYPMADMIVVPNYDLFDKEGVYRAGGWEGAWDLDVRLAQMDREGIAAEFVYHGFYRVADPAFSVMNGVYAPELVDAGVRAYDRWAFDTFGAAKERLALVGAMGACTDLAGTMDEVAWCADHGFLGTYAPGFLGMPGQAPLYDEFWDPLWALYADRGVALVVHGGYGLPQGYALEEIEAAITEVDARGGDDTDLVMTLAQGIFSDKIFQDLHHRQAMWQLLLGGVFDRHPALKLFLTEVRADWIPATLAHLDKVYAERRADLPSSRKPSDWWETNCIVGASFMHKSEIEHRDEIGVDHVMFGRDYPHTEGTWPNTLDFLGDLFAGVPESDARKILGENAIRFFGFDAAALAAVADRVGPTVEQITGGPPALDPRLIEHFGMRSGYLKPFEGASRIAELDELLRDDFKGLTASTRA